MNPKQKKKDAAKKKLSTGSKKLEKTRTLWAFK